ncbi:hypothetical protein INR49_007245 [Caranx melampygus]|nr:hypothetical protein INR49_007245 [Caranx melampygus]
MHRSEDIFIIIIIIIIITSITSIISEARTQSSISIRTFVPPHVLLLNHWDIKASLIRAGPSSTTDQSLCLISRAEIW